MCQNTDDIHALREVAHVSLVEVDVFDVRARPHHLCKDCVGHIGNPLSIALVGMVPLVLAVRGRSDFHEPLVNAWFQGVDAGGRLQRYLWALHVRGGTLHANCEIDWELCQAFPLQAFRCLGLPTPVTFSQHEASIQCSNVWSVCGLTGFLIGASNVNT